MTWYSNEEKLLCHIIIDDGVRNELGVGNPGIAYFRAFIVQNRQTQKVTLKYRFSHKDGEKSWYEVEAKEPDPQKASTELQMAMKQVLRIALRGFGATNEQLDRGIVSFFPPDDGGDGFKTLQWMQERDLIEVTKVEKIPEDKS